MVAATVLEKIVNQTTAVSATEGIRGAGFIPPGVVLSYAGMTAPVGWAFCYGQAISRTTYADLFVAITLTLTGNTTSGNAVIASASLDITALGLTGAKVEGAGITTGTTILSATSGSITLSANATATATGITVRILPFGTGDNSTTFTLPDGRGRALAGRDNMGGTAASRLTTGINGLIGANLGTAGGAEVHTLTAAQIPTINSSGTLSLSSSNLVQSNVSTGSYSTGSGGASIWQAFSNGSAQALVSPTASGTTASTNTGGTSHNITQPTLVLNHIIKT